MPHWLYFTGSYSMFIASSINKILENDFIERKYKTTKETLQISAVKVTLPINNYKVQIGFRTF